MAKVSDTTELEEKLKDSQEPIEDCIEIAEDEVSAKYISENFDTDKLIENADHLISLYEKTDDRRAMFYISNCFVRITNRGYASKNLMNVALGMTKASNFRVTHQDVSFIHRIWVSNSKDYLKEKIDNFDTHEKDSSSNEISVRVAGREIGTIEKFGGDQPDKLTVELWQEMQVVETVSEEGIIGNGFDIWTNIIENNNISGVPSAVVDDACYILMNFASQSFVHSLLEFVSKSYSNLEDELQEQILSSLCQSSGDIEEVSCNYLLQIVIDASGEIPSCSMVEEYVRSKYGIEVGTELELTRVRSRQYRQACVALSYICTDSSIVRLLTKVGIVKP
jgi:hypothetical protein